MKSAWIWLPLLGISAGILYFHRLGFVTPYLSIDEVFQARQAVVLATTGRNLNGERPSVYFPDPDQPMGREPVFIYATAALLKIAPFSEATVRAPSALAGVLDVLLMFVVVRELFGRTAPAVLAAVVLMFTPAHFFQSRIGHMQIGTATSTLAWLACLASYLNTGRPRVLFAGTLFLALGMYAYGSGLVMMPVFFVVTLAIVSMREAPERRPSALRSATAGFLVTVVPLTVYYLAHLERFAQLAAFYTRGEYNSGLGMQGFFGAQAISHFDVWWDCYNPDKLFFSGDSDLRVSTRTAGDFLLPLAVPMIVGLWTARRQLKAEVWVLLLCGLVLAPLPAAVVGNTDVKRSLPLLPFAIIVIVCGFNWMFTSGRRALQACAVAVIVLSAIQAKGYLAYYFGAFGADSSARFGGNVRGAIQETLALSRTDQDCVALDRRVYYLDHQWDLYSRAYGRTDLVPRTIWLNADGPVSIPSTCRGTTVLGVSGDSRFADWRATPIRELDGTSAFAVYRRDAR